MHSIKVYTVGIGTDAPAPFLVDTIFGKSFVYQNVEFDEDTLKMIATKTHGKYFKAGSTKELKEIYDEINRMEKSPKKVKKFIEYEELFAYFIIPAFFLICIELVSGVTIFRGL